MNCSRIRDLLPDYSVELLEAREHRAVEAHLDACEECRRELRALNTVVALVEEHGVRQPPVGLFNGIRNRIESGEVTQQPLPWWSAWFNSRPARAVAMAGAMAAVVMGLMLPVSSPNIPVVEMHPRPESAPVNGVATTALGDSIRQHALSAGDGPLTDRVAWEAMAQLVADEKEREGARTQ